MNDFLLNLKNAVENGEMNSESARRINEINSLAEKKIKSGVDIGESIERRITESGGIKKASSEEELLKANEIHANKIAEIEQIDKINAIIPEIDERFKYLFGVLDKINVKDIKLCPELSKYVLYLDNLSKTYDIEINKIDVDVDAATEVILNDMQLQNYAADLFLITSDTQKKKNVFITNTANAGCFNLLNVVDQISNLFDFNRFFICEAPIFKYNNKTYSIDKRLLIDEIYNEIENGRYVVVYKAVTPSEDTLYFECEVI